MPDLSEMMSKRRPMAQPGPCSLSVCSASRWLLPPGWRSRFGRRGSPRRNSTMSPATMRPSCRTGSTSISIRSAHCVPSMTPPSGVNRREFDLFTSQILAGHVDTMRLVWCPRVGGNERGTFEREVRDSGLPDFSIKTWAPTGPVHDSEVRSEYFPILYSTVSHARTATFGTDLASEQVRSRAIRRAVDGDMMATAQDIELRNPIDGKRAGFLVLLAGLQARTASRQHRDPTPKC